MVDSTNLWIISKPSKGKTGKKTPYIIIKLLPPDRTDWARPPIRVRRKSRWKYRRKWLAKGINGHLGKDSGKLSQQIYE